MPQSPLKFLTCVKSEEQLVEAVHAYVGAWMPSSLARLPLPVRVSEIRCGEDVSRIAVTIAQLRLDPRIAADVHDVLEQLHPFFSEASTRLSQMQTFGMRRDSTLEAMRKLFG
jgi:hypothetical protein